MRQLQHPNEGETGRKPLLDEKWLACLYDGRYSQHACEEPLVPALVPPSIWPPLRDLRRRHWRKWRRYGKELCLRVIHGTAAVGENVPKKTEQAATASGGRGKVLRGRASSTPVMAGDHNNMEIPTRHKNKPRMKAQRLYLRELFVGTFSKCSTKFRKIGPSSTNETRFL